MLCHCDRTQGFASTHTYANMSVPMMHFVWVPCFSNVQGELGTHIHRYLDSKVLFSSLGHLKDDEQGFF